VKVCSQPPQAAFSHKITTGLAQSLIYYTVSFYSQLLSLIFIELSFLRQLSADDRAAVAIIGSRHFFAFASLAILKKRQR